MKVPNDQVRNVLTAFAEMCSAEGAKDELIQLQTDGVCETLSILERNGTALLFGATGAGKTVQAALVALIMAQRTGRPALLLAPNTDVMRERWQADLDLLLHCLPGASGRLAARLMNMVWTEVEKYSKPWVNKALKDCDKHPHLFVGTTPRLARFDESAPEAKAVPHLPFMEALNPAVVVVDEAHLRTDGDTKTRKALMKLLAGRKVLTLTATPVSRKAESLALLLELNRGAGSARNLTAYQEKVHSAVRTWWGTQGDESAMEQAVQAAEVVKPPAQQVFRSHIVRQQPEGSSPRTPSRVAVTPTVEWLRGYGIARVLPVLLACQEEGEGRSVRPSDSYRRMLLSSSAAFWDSHVAVELRRRAEARHRSKARDAAGELQRLLLRLLGPESGAASGHERHPKVDWTATRAAQASKDRQVLVFVQFLRSVDSLQRAIARKAKKEGLEVYVGDAAKRQDVEHFRQQAKGGVLLATPQHSAGIELDASHGGKEKDRLLLYHDLPWSAVVLQQQQGRLRRAKRNFPNILLEAPVLDVPDDDRLWHTVMGRFAVTDLVDMGDEFDTSDLVDPGRTAPFPKHFIDRLRLDS